MSDTTVIASIARTGLTSASRAINVAMHDGAAQKLEPLQQVAREVRETRALVGGYLGQNWIYRTIPNRISQGIFPDHVVNALYSVYDSSTAASDLLINAVADIGAKPGNAYAQLRDAQTAVTQAREAALRLVHVAPIS